MLHRRTLLGATALALIASYRPLAAAADERGFQRVRPGQPGWPDAAAWNGLRDRLGGALWVPPTLLQSCAADASCRPTHSLLRNPYYVGDQPSGTQVCGYLDAWSAQPSAYVAKVRADADVVEAVNFARTHRLRLVVKGGGHSYQGTSNAADSLLVWTRAMRRITLHDAFVPKGTGQSGMPAVTIEAGAMWIDAYDAVTTKGGRYVQGGGCDTVGVAGLVQGGGFGSFSKRYGMAASSLLQADIVTADGVLRTVSEAAEPELFWALRGGAGGNFGVVTRVTLRTHDLAKTAGGSRVEITAANADAFRALIDHFIAFYAKALCNPHWGEQAAFHPDNRLTVSMVFLDLSGAQAREIWRPFLDWAGQRPDIRITSPFWAGAENAAGWWDTVAQRARHADYIVADDRPGASPVHAWWKGDGDQVSCFLYTYDSVWMPHALLDPTARPRLVAALYDASRATKVELHFNKGMAGGTAEAVDGARAIATHPSVCDAFALAIVADGGAPRYPGFPRADDRAGHDAARRNGMAMAALRRASPGGGSYCSEASYFDPDWRGHFWGENYARLRAAKARYDPDGLFFTHHGPGSEDWSADGFRRL